MTRSTFVVGRFFALIDLVSYVHVSFVHVSFSWDGHRKREEREETVESKLTQGANIRGMGRTQIHAGERNKNVLRNEKERQIGEQCSA